MFGGRFFGGRFFGGRYFGKQGTVVLGRHFGGRYFGKEYYGRRYWGTYLDVPFALEVTAGLSVAGVVQVAGNVIAPAAFNVAGNVGLTGSVSVGAVLSFDSEDFAVTPPLEVTALAGVTSVAGDLEWGYPSAPGDGSYFGNRYFGSRHFGARYWSTTKPFLLTATNTITTSGVVGVSGGIEIASAVAQTNTLEFSGVVAVAGDLSYAAAEQDNSGGKGDNADDGWVFSRYKSFRQVEEADPKRKRQKIRPPEAIEPATVNALNPVLDATSAAFIKSQITAKPIASQVDPAVQEDEEEAVTLILSMLV